MENKKTLKDLNDMKNKPSMFGNQYEFFFMTLEDYCIGKIDGRERIKRELLNWDSEAKKEIVCKLADIIETDGLVEFNRDDILLLAK